MMPITKQTIAEKIGAYLRHDVSLSQLVDWAENVMLHGEFDDQSITVAPANIARLGVADVRAFGLTWEDCGAILRMLGYHARVEVVPV